MGGAVAEVDKGSWSGPARYGVPTVGIGLGREVEPGVPAQDGTDQSEGAAGESGAGDGEVRT